MEQNLDTKLTRIENTVNIMKTNLRLPENEVIEKVAEATNLHSLANIFIQEEEPEIKDGIWFKTDGETHPYNIVAIDGDIVLPGEWRFDLGYYASPSPGFVSDSSDNQHSVVYHGFIYSVATKSLYQTEPSTGITKTILSNFTSYGLSKIHVFNDTMYILSNTEVYKIHEDFTYTRYTLTALSSTPGAFCVMPDNDTIISSDSRGKIYKHSMSTGAYSLIGTTGTSAYWGHIEPLSNTEILLLGSTTKWGLYNGIYNLETNQYTSYTNTLDRVFANKQYNTWKLGNKLYMVLYENESEWNNIVITKGIFAIDLVNLTYEELTEQFFKGDFASLHNILLIDDKYYAIDNRSNKMFIVPQDSVTAQYDDNAIMLFQAPLTRTEYRTALWTYPNLKGRMLFSFFDAYYYNTETGIDFTSPVYYGNGTEWIKIKN